MRCAALGWLVLSLGIGACEPATLFAGIDRGAAERLQQRLEAGGVAAEFRPRGTGTADVRVPRAAVADALVALDCPVGAPMDDPCAAPPSSPLLPAPRQDRARARQLLSCALSHTAQLLPGVVEARIQLSVPEPLWLDDPVPRPKAVAVALVRDGFDPDSMRRLLGGAVPGLESQNIEVIERMAPQPAPAEGVALAPLGPMRVDAESLGLAKRVLAVLLLLNGLTSATLLLVWARMRRGRPRPPR